MHSLRLYHRSHKRHITLLNHPYHASTDRKNGNIFCTCYPNRNGIWQLVCIFFLGRRCFSSFSSPSFSFRWWLLGGGGRRFTFLVQLFKTTYCGLIVQCGGMPPPLACFHQILFHARPFPLPYNVPKFTMPTALPNRAAFS